MELNISCVRSILLTVEKYETIYEPVSFDEEMHSYYKDYLDFCDIEQILYHVQYCIKAGLFYIIRGMLAGTVPVEDIVYRDTESYFGILYTDNNRKPICRLNLDTKNKQLLIPDENKKFERIYITSLNDIYKYKNKLIEVAKRYL